MNPTRMSFLVAPLVVALAACAGSPQEEEFLAAAPSTAAFSIDLDGGGATAVAAADGITALEAAAEPLQPEACHPLLFARSEAVARRMNRHLAHALGRIERVIARHPALSTDGEMVWEEQRDGLDVRFTMTRSGDIFGWLLELRPAGAGDDAWVTVFSGNIDRAGAAARHEGKGALALDLDALHSVVPDLDVAGTIRATFDLTAARRLVTLDVGGVRWAAPDYADHLERVAPRDATYTYLREPGVGGSLVLVDELVLGCPANPSLLPADVKLVSRWYRTASGEIHGRSDALATGGQLSAGEAWMGVTCHARAADPRSSPSEFYWMIKAEDAAGATLQSWERTVGSGACDEVFGPVPSRTDSATDLDFGFDPTVPYPFPGMF
jgi:hypothetical protein